MMAEEGYKPHGWLGLQLGKAIWIGCWDLEMADSNFPQVAKRVEAAKSATGSNDGSAAKPPLAAASSNPTPSVKTVATAINSASGDKVMEMLKSMQAQLTKLTEMQASLAASVEDIKSNQMTMATSLAKLAKQ